MRAAGFVPRKGRLNETTVPITEHNLVNYSVTMGPIYEFLIRYIDGLKQNH